MPKVTKEDALLYHSRGRHGKIEVIPTKPYSTQFDLSLAYTPGVAYPCLEIEKTPEDVYNYTAKGNLVAVISNGTAVLGLGDIGAMAGKPVMEGKGLLFKIFADVDVFDIEVDEKDPRKLIEFCRQIAPTFGGINLEDIKAPECFEVETELKKMLDIPVFHDDQHGTAIISAAGLLNALEITGKKIETIKMVVCGAGAAAISCSRLYVSLGVKKENIVMVDTKGVLNKKRTDLNKYKQEFITSRDLETLEQAVRDSDIFLGLSAANMMSKEMLASMAENPIVFAMANPNPEISFEDAMATRNDLIFATGRSDYPNQINNVLGFPFIFRGALDVRASTINEEMKLAAAKALAELAKKEVPVCIMKAYNVDKLTYGKEYIIPKPLDPRLISCIAPAVAKAAMDTGVAKYPITDWDKYRKSLDSRLSDHIKKISRCNVD
jgi:malate dehydrogenase (oxaloacetate-decarboxylating)(NADP+)